MQGHGYWQTLPVTRENDGSIVSKSTLIEVKMAHTVLLDEISDGFVACFTH